MEQPRQSQESDQRLHGSRGKVNPPLSAAARRTIAAVEGAVAGVLAALPSGHRMRLLVALSGGPDSVAALLALYRLRGRFDFELAAAHLNHRIRGLESDRDEQFVRELCNRFELELIVEQAQALSPFNLEERAREFRYEFLNRAADALDARFIVLGHHRDDQAETVLLRLLRGAGIAGLGAMSELGPGRLLRPLLSLDRDTTRRYLQVIGANYVIDSSNLDCRALRNRLRADLLPHLARDYSPGIARRLAELASEMRELNRFISAEARQVLDTRLLQASNRVGAPSYRVDVREFRLIDQALARAIIRELIERGVGNLRRIQRVHINAMCRLATDDNRSGAVILPGGWRFRREYDSAVLERATPAGTGAPTSADGGELRLMPGANQLGSSCLSVRELSSLEPSFPAAPWHPPSRFEAYFDAAATPLLSVRCVRAGDRIRPLGLVGSRKIHDVFVDNKVGSENRKFWPLVIWRDEVVWVPGLVRSGVALITAESRKVLYLRADSLPDDPKVRLPGL
ncbi:MAG: tRNA lysidine(34) synthetase TilS [Deltaproteobacteria bacterium]|nr:tRNA lysidine(34) synthetase TilS [Deltaproteobacteria bacterium]